MHIFSKQTNIFIKVAFVMYLLRICSQIMLLTVLEPRFRYGPADSDIAIYINITIALPLILSVLFRKLPLTLLFLVIGATNDVVHGYLDYLYGPYLEIRTFETLLSVLRSLVGSLFFIVVVLRSPLIKKYYRGLPSAEINEETGKYETDFKQFMPTIYWVVFISIIGSMIIPSFATTVSRFFGFDQREKVDANGFEMYGDVEIEISQKENGAISFGWNGRPVSYVKITRGYIDERTDTAPIWATASRENKDNCMASPVVFGEIDTECADSMGEVELYPEERYTVFISRYFDLFKEEYPPVGWAAREFEVTPE